MPAASSRGWPAIGAPGSPAGQVFRRNHIVKITGPWGYLYVHKDVAWRFQGFLDEIHARGYRIKGATLDDWGYNHRYIAGTRSLSNHSWGLAVDINALTNPQSKTLITDMPDWVIECADRWGFFWGGWYKAPTKKDPMHFEFLGTPAQARNRNVRAAVIPKHDELDLPDLEDPNMPPLPSDVVAELDVPGGKLQLQYNGVVVARGNAKHYGDYVSLPEKSRIEGPVKRGFYIIKPHDDPTIAAKGGYRLVATTSGQTYRFGPLA